MPTFSKVSLAQLGTCDARLQLVLHEAIKYVDFSVIEGHRGQAAQDKAVAAGNSKTPWPTSKHNSTPSKAVDIAPYPIDWSDGERPHLRFAHLMGVVDTCAQQLGVKLRFGMHFKTLLDLPHVEIVE